MGYNEKGSPKIQLPINDPVDLQNVVKPSIESWAVGLFVPSLIFSALPAYIVCTFVLTTSCRCKFFRASQSQLNTFRCYVLAEITEIQALGMLILVRFIAAKFHQNRPTSMKTFHSILH